ncbi:MAG: hypothetical protein KF837_33330 [Labilithrix sp.]|nr:hypothetical protein [Labilithrix sp.]
MADPDLPAIFRRAIALAVASSSCAIACGAKTSLAPGDEDDGAPATIACVQRPQPSMFTKATCEGDDRNYGYECHARWAVARPADVDVGIELAGEECAALCGASPAWSECAHRCAPLQANTCEVACDWITCGIGAAGAGGYMATAGRRPPGFVAARPHGRDDLAALFLANAELEAASVDAFQWLERELEAHGAPERLVRWAARAAVEEARHAEEMTALARRFGAESALDRDRVEPTIRDLDAIALDNAVEGCVLETYAALVATWQAERATEPAVRATMRGIAADETSHAALSWALHRWALARVADPSRVVAAQAAGFARLRAAIARDDLSAETRRRAGLPSRTEALALLDGLYSQAPNARGHVAFAGTSSPIRRAPSAAASGLTPKP